MSAFGTRGWSEEYTVAGEKILQVLFLAPQKHESDTEDDPEGEYHVGEQGMSILLCQSCVAAPCLVQQVRKERTRRNGNHYNHYSAYRRHGYIVFNGWRSKVMGVQCISGHRQQVIILLTLLHKDEFAAQQAIAVHCHCGIGQLYLVEAYTTALQKLPGLSP